MRRIALLPALVLLSLPLRAGVLIVDSDGSGDFLDVQSAVDAAVDGDAILVRGLHHAAFTIAGKSLTVVGLGVGPMDPIITGNVVVTGIAAGQQSLLSHLQLVGSDGEPGQPGGEALTLAACAGPVHLWRCVVKGGRGSGVGGQTGLPQTGGTALGVNACADVALSTCILVGGRGGNNGPQAGAGGPALHIVAGSNVVLMASSAVGGIGGGAYPATSEAGGAGGAGVVLDQGTLFAGGFSSDALYGGAGGAGISFWGDGGNGLELGVIALARVRGPIPFGGASQVAPDSSAQRGTPGAPVVTLGGTLETLPGMLPFFAGVNAVSVAGEAIILDVSTLASGNGAKLLLASLQGTSAYFGSQQSPLLVAPPWIAGGVVLPDGKLTLQAPGLPPGVDGVAVHLQAWAAGVGFTNAQHLVLLEQSPFD